VTVLEIIQRSADFLQPRGVDSPRLQIELMLAHVLNLPRLQLYLNFERALSEGELARLREMVKRRAAREPLQHILGSTSFCGLEIKCSPAALVPRPETELLAERAWQFLSEMNRGTAGGPQPSEAGRSRDGAPCHPAALDIGTGTGCIAIALALNVPNALIHSVDVSDLALALARENAANNKVTGQIQFHLGDAFAVLPGASQFDVIVSNPPYIPSAEINSLQPEVRDFDPKLALDGGADGLDFCRRIANQAPPFLKSDGRLMVEFGDGQAEALKNIFSGENWIVDEIVADYSARPRILIARRGK
jgi:release factor glutamine methyltransferase